ncbi:hypothetical protein L9F63_015089, partial [Diploptera punctata]
TLRDEREGVGWGRPIIVNTSTITRCLSFALIALQETVVQNHSSVNSILKWSE